MVTIVKYKVNYKALRALLRRTWILRMLIRNKDPKLSVCTRLQNVCTTLRGVAPPNKQGSKVKGVYCVYCVLSTVYCVKFESVKFQRTDVKMTKTVRRKWPILAE